MATQAVTRDALNTAANVQNIATENGRPSSYISAATLEGTNNVVQPAALAAMHKEAPSIQDSDAAVISSCSIGTEVRPSDPENAEAQLGAAAGTEASSAESAPKDMGTSLRSGINAPQCSDATPAYANTVAPAMTPRLPVAPRQLVLVRMTCG